MLTIAIMQPTYLPWIGYLDMIDQCDCFVLLDSVQFDRRSWQQRNRVKGPGGPLWLTVPVLSKGRREQLIREVVIDPSAGFQEKHLRTVQHFYAQAAFFGDYFDGLAATLSSPQPLLAELTIALVRWLCERIGVHTPLMRSSELQTEGRKAELLVRICEALGATRYLSPPGSRAYLEGNEQFDRHGITLVYHAYQHPVYRQLHGPFLPYMSSLDLMLNEGPASLEIIRSGRWRAAGDAGAGHPRSVREFRATGRWTHGG